MARKTQQRRIRRKRRILVGYNGIRQSYTYDAAGRLTEIVSTHASGAELDRITYEHDESGHIIARSRTGGNSVNETPFVATFDEDNHMLTYNGYALTYDDNGNLIERETETGKLVYEYNSDNRLIRFERHLTGQSQPETVAEYEYDRTGRRISKTVNGNKTMFAWDSHRLIAEYDQSQSLLKRYSYGIGYSPTQVTDQNGIYNVHTDHLDTPQYLTDQAGNVVWKANYAAYGSVEADEDPDGDGVAITFNVRFPGQYEDAESGLYYNYHRYYDPKIGRYVTRDPIGLLGGLNMHAYADGNPIQVIDPDGLLGRGNMRPNSPPRSGQREQFNSNTPFRNTSHARWNEGQQRLQNNLWNQQWLDRTLQNWPSPNDMPYPGREMGSEDISSQHC